MEQLDLDYRGPVRYGLESRSFPMASMLNQIHNLNVIHPITPRYIDPLQDAYQEKILNFNEVSPFVSNAVTLEQEINRKGSNLEYSPPHLPSFAASMFQMLHDHKRVSDLWQCPVKMRWRPHSYLNLSLKPKRFDTWKISNFPPPWLFKAAAWRPNLIGCYATYTPLTGGCQASARRHNVVAEYGNSDWIQSTRREEPRRSMNMRD